MKEKRGVFQKFMLEHTKVFSLPFLLEWTNQLPGELDGTFIFSQLNTRVYFGIQQEGRDKNNIQQYFSQKEDKRITKKSEGEGKNNITILSEVNPIDMPLWEEISNLWKMLINQYNIFENIENIENIHIKHDQLNKLLYHICTAKESGPIIIHYNNNEIHTRSFKEIFKKKKLNSTLYFSQLPSLSQNKKQKEIDEFKKEVASFIQQVNVQSVNILPAQWPSFLTENKTKKLPKTTRINIPNIATALAKFLEKNERKQKQAVSLLQENILKIANKNNEKETLKLYYESTWTRNKIKKRTISPQEQTKNNDINIFTTTIQNEESTKHGIQKEQDTQNKVFSEHFPKKGLVIINYDGTIEINNSGENLTEYKNHITLDTIRNKIYINNHKLTTKELHSQTMAVELLKYFLDKKDEVIFNSELQPSSYTKNKNLLNSKVIIPLKRAIKERLGKEIPLSCFGGLHDFSIQLKSHDLKFWLIKRLT